MVTLEQAIAQFTQPLNGQYPRPWMTALCDPVTATVFVVGKNQAKGYPVEAVGSHVRHLDALFNRNGAGCRALYDEITGAQASPTRRNTDALVGLLREQGVPDVIETNVVCYSTPLSAELALAVHAGGRDRGQEIFRTLLRLICPRVMICHGRDTRRLLGRLLNVPIAEPATVDGPVVMSRVHTDRFTGVVFPVLSLAPPAWNRWSRWAEPYLERVASAVAAELGRVRTIGRA